MSTRAAAAHGHGAVSRLAQVQGDFQAYLLQGERAIEAHVLGTTRVPVATRLAIYGDAYGSRLAEALASNFPALAQLLGETDFQQLAVAYVRAHESPFFSIRYYGDHLAEFLARTEPIRQRAACSRSWPAGSGLSARSSMPRMPSRSTHEALARVEPQRVGAAALRLSPERAAPAAALERAADLAGGHRGA